MKKLISVILTIAITAGTVSAFSLHMGATYEGRYDTLANQLRDNAATELYIEEAEDYMTFVAELERAGATLSKTSGTTEASRLIYTSGNGAFAGKTVYLANDIVLNEGFDADDPSDFGGNDKLSLSGSKDAIKGFSGTFDGQGYTISGICHVAEAASGGSIFGYATGNATVKNVTIENCYIQSKNPGLATIFTSATNSSVCTIENVRIADDVVLYSERETDLAAFIGGFIGNVGTATVTVRNSIFEGSITLRSGVAEQVGLVGGLVGAVVNYSDTINSPILNMENCGFFGKLSWNKQSRCVSKAIGALQSFGSTVPDLPIRVKMSGCMIGGKIFGGTALVVGALSASVAGIPVVLTYENTVWTPEDLLKEMGGTIGGTTTHGLNKTLESSGYVAHFNGESTLFGDALNADATPTGQKYDMRDGWLFTADGPVPISLLGSCDGGRGTRLSPDATYCVGYQAKKDGESFAVRFVCVGKDASYSGVEAQINAGDTESVTHGTDKVYGSLVSAGRTVGAAELGGEYVYTADTQIGADEGHLDVTVITYHKVGEQRYADSVRTFRIVASSIVTGAVAITPEYRIRSYSSVAGHAVTLRTEIAKKTAMQLTVSGSAAEKTIYLGTAEDFSGIEGLDLPSYTSYRIKTVGNDVYIAVGSSTLPEGAEKTAPLAIEAFVDALTFCSGAYVVSSELDLTSDLTGISESVPVLAGREAALLYNCGTGGYQAKYEGVLDRAVMSGYEAQLTGVGYSKYSENKIADNEFATYKKGDAQINLSWFASKGLFHITYGKNDCQLPTSPVTGYTRVAEATVSMMQLTETGLSMVAQLPDGSFVIVDGGTRAAANNYGKENKAVLWDFLQSHLPAGESKPRITWIITHAHSDHITMPNAMLMQYCDDIILERMIYNYPDYAGMGFGGDASRAAGVEKTMRVYYPDTPIYRPHTGDVLYLAGCEIEFLYTHEDLSGTDFKWMNDTSTAFRITMEGKSCMVFADCENTSTSFMYDVYGDELKSDVMQVPHHGAGSASWELYSAVDPSICLWSVNQHKFYNDGRMLGTNAGMSYNAMLRDDAYGVRSHYHQSQTVTVKMKDLSVTTKVNQASIDAES